jgi:hypothetical protein
VVVLFSAGLLAVPLVAVSPLDLSVLLSVFALSLLLPGAVLLWWL